MYSRPDGLSGPHMGSLFILRLLHTPSPTNHHVFCSLNKEGCTGDSGSHSVVHTLLQQFLICVTFGNFSERYF